jgi:putative PIN family toxin of toxin-antitoxin system
VKVVFDTNILVSAFTLPGGRGSQALGRIIHGADALAISKPIVDELVGVLARKFGQDREQLARTAVFLAELAEVVDPRDLLSVLTDEPDNRILECAAAAGAERIVTGDRAMLDLGRYQDIRIITLADYLA